jgi:bacterioferritin-associated ferredoxin
MRKFKDFFDSHEFNHPMESPSVTLEYDGKILELRFDTKDVVVKASYQGTSDPWLSSLCFLIEGKSLEELREFQLKNWEEAFKEDQSFWDFYQEEQERFLHPALEMLRASMEIYRGQDFLYKEASPLVCRCFGVRESVILDHLNHHDNPTLDTLGEVCHAGKGCRSCVPQLKRWLSEVQKKNTRFHKDRSLADWILLIDARLAQYTKKQELHLEVEKINGTTVVISYDSTLSQREEEMIGKDLQRFLSEVDSDFSFFLRRARHFS